MVAQFKAVIKTRLGYDRFECFIAENIEEVRSEVEANLKRGEKIRYIVKE